MANIDTISNNKFVIAIKYSKIIGPALTFELPNQFLVWMAQKVIALSDLNLLFTKYYKEKLEPQLKNRKTNTTNHQLTESIELIELQLLTDWTLIIKPSFAKLFPLTTPSSLLLLYPSDNFSALLILFHNFFYPHLNPERKILAHHLIVSRLSIGIKKQSLK